MPHDWEAEGLLKGVRGKAREARRRLLDELAQDGVSLEELRRAVEEDRLALLPVERVLEQGEGRYTAAEVAERSGLEHDFLLRNLQALGVPIPDPEEPAFTDADVEAAKRQKAFCDAGLPPEKLIEASRVIGISMAQVAAASRELVGDVMVRPGDTERDVGLRFAAAARHLAPMTGEALEYAFNLHLREQIRNEVIDRTQLASGGLPDEQEISVCFADLVGFTSLGEQLAPEELGRVTGRLTEMAGEVARAPVRLVKMIGDAAMLVSPRETDALLEAALELIDMSEGEEEFPLLRAGVAQGNAVGRAGDWYGRPVNLASRITGVAYAGSVLCAEEVFERAGDGYRWSDAGRKRLRGIDGTVHLYRCRPEGAEEGDPD